jgi:GntR family transcriptional repressor for pyruvate dehydrogenase complex
VPGDDLIDQFLRVVPGGGGLGLSGARSSGALAKPKKAAVLVAQLIVDEIVERGLERGDPLMAEREMVERYEVSRGTLREALRILETYGLISIKTGPRGGTIVADAGSRALASVIALVLQVNRASFRSILEAKVELEPLMARQAAERRDDSDLEILHGSIAEMKTNIDDDDVFATQNQVFHAAVCWAAKNPVLYIVVAAFGWIQYGASIRPDTQRQNREAIITAHRGIYKAIRSRSPEIAEAAMKIHVREFADYATSVYGDILDAPLRWDTVVP